MSRSRRGARGRKPANRPDLSAQFWGREPETEPGPIRMSDDPAAMVRSLGPPPLKGHEVPAEYTFRLVYDKAVGLAATLAAAAELDGHADVDTEPVDTEPVDTPSVPDA